LEDVKEEEEEGPAQVQVRGRESAKTEPRPGRNKPQCLFNAGRSLCQSGEPIPATGHRLIQEVGGFRPPTGRRTKP